MRAAFVVGWVVWFASIMAGVLYALGFALYANVVIREVWVAAAGSAPEWLGGRLSNIGLAVAATLFYSFSLARTSGGGGNWATIGKVLVFGALIAAGLWQLVGVPQAAIVRNLTPFFEFGAAGLFAAMGYTFIAFQGFDLIAAVAGEVKQPERTLPRAMLLSLVITLLIYLPLLFIVMTVGTEPGQSIAALSEQQPETIIAVATETFLGTFGFWLVVVAALLSMLSALQANLLAASRIAFSMASDRTLPRFLSARNARSGTPVVAVWTSAAMLAVLLLLLPDVAAAGAAASLIFLVTFTLVHWISVLARQRSTRVAFQTPWFPLVPVVGGVACAVLALFQGIVVPAAGGVTAIWVVIGVTIYLALLAPRARVFDALSEARDPTLMRQRGRSPLVLVPIANPANAAAMVTVANALTPSEVGRVLLLSVVRGRADPAKLPDALDVSQRVLRQSLTTSLRVGLAPEALTTLAPDPWEEIVRVAKDHRCESMLIGLSTLGESSTQDYLDRVLSEVDSDVVVLRAPEGWRLGDGGASRVLVPVGGGGDQDVLRARLLGSLARTGQATVTYLQVIPEAASEENVAETEVRLKQIAEDEVPEDVSVEVRRSDDPIAEIAAVARDYDLTVLGLQRLGHNQKMLGRFAMGLAQQTEGALLLISRRG